MALTSTEFDYIRNLVRDQTAIVLEPGKEYLIEARLLPLLRREGLASFQDLVTTLNAQPYNGLQRKVAEAMTTNETSFLRDLHPFEAIKSSILPELAAKRADELRLDIWCSACSSGQEPYSLAILIREHFPGLGDWSLRLMASDLSTEVLARARAGRYTQLEVNRGLPASYLVKYFQQQGTEWVIKDEIRRMVEYFEINLAKPWPLLPAMDLVLMRNVLIYFDLETKKEVLLRVRRALKPDGFLMLGGAETTLNIDDSFQRFQAGRACWYQPIRK